LKLEELHSMDSDPTYSNPEVNLLRLRDTVRFLSNVSDVTSDWMKEHSNHILFYSYVLSNVKLEEESADNGFQKKVRELRLLVKDLEMSIKSTRTFSLNKYRIAVKRLLDIYVELLEMDELTDSIRLLGK
jgi:hypothetical protein